MSCDQNEKISDCSEKERIRGDYSSRIEMIAIKKKIKLRVPESLVLLETDGKFAQLMLKCP